MRPFRELLVRGVRRDTIWLLGAQSTALVVTFVATPIELHRMGAERYGIFVVLSLAAGFATLFDFGAAYAVLRFVPWHRARGDTTAAQRIVTSGLIASVSIGALFALAVLLLARPLTAVLDISPAVYADTLAAIRITSAFIPILLVLNMLSGLTRAVGMFALSGALAAGQVIALNVAWVVVAGTPNDIVKLAVAQVAIGCLTAAVGFALIKLRQGWALRPVMPKWASFREILSFGAKTSAGQGAMGLITSGDKLMLGALLPVASLPIYSIPFSFAVRIMMVPSSLSSAVFPPVVDAMAHHHLEEVARLRHRAFAVIGLVSGLLAMNCIFGGEPLLALWIGPAFASRAWPAMAVFGVAFGLLACGFVGNVLLDAVGQPGRAARLMGAGAAVGLACAVVAATVWRTPVAASFGTSVGLVVIGLGGIERARTIALPLSRTQVIRTVFGAWPPLVVVAALTRVAASAAEVSPLVSLAAVACATGAMAMVAAYRRAVFKIPGVRPQWGGAAPPSPLGVPDPPR
jgi:O-antigen/teichoic acid export membrane protein